jgi:hypothetical protein
MDGQHSSHGDSYAYSAPEWPEFYDLWTDSLFGSKHEDVPIYWEKMLDKISSYVDRHATLSAAAASPGSHISFADEEITVVDIGTGTGRVIKELVSALVPGLIAFAEQEKENWNVNGNGNTQNYHPRVQFVGLDHGQAMLWRAEDMFMDNWLGNWDRAAKYLKSPQWVRTTAGDFVEECAELEKGVDLLIFAAGGISHLTGEEERKAFLGQVRKGLKERESLAVVSVLTDFIKGNEGNEGGEARMEGAARIESKDHAGLVYIKTPTVTNMDGDLRTDKFSVRAVRQDDAPTVDSAGSGEKEVWQKDMAWSVKLFDEAEWKTEVQSEGLKITSVKKGNIQRWYFLQLADS